jgi:hypothetical protein
LPVPSQSPFWPHAIEPPSVHWLVGFGAWPAATLAQVPLLLQA